MTKKQSILAAIIVAILVFLVTSFFVTRTGD